MEESKEGKKQSYIFSIVSLAGIVLGGIFGEVIIGILSGVIAGLILDSIFNRE